MKHTKCVGKTCALVQIKMYECNPRKPKSMNAVHANQRCTRTVHAIHDAHGNILTSRVHLKSIFTSLIFRAHAGYFACIFRNASSRVVAARMCSHV